MARARMMVAFIFTRVVRAELRTLRWFSTVSWCVCVVACSVGDHKRIRYLDAPEERARGMEASTAAHEATGDDQAGQPTIR